MLHRIEEFDALTRYLKNDTALPFFEVGRDIFHLSPGHSAQGAGLAIIALTHGNEPAGLRTLTQLLHTYIEGRFHNHISVYLILGNRPAFEQNVRYIDSDLNRSYGKGDNYNPDSAEEVRAKEIEAILDNCGFLIDLHQTVEPTETPFIISPYSEETHTWASHLVPELPLLLHPPASKLATSTGYMAAKGAVSLTAELGGSGEDLYQATLGLHLVEQAMKTCRVPYELSPLRVPVKNYAIHYLHPYSGGAVKFHSGTHTFMEVKQGDELGTVGDQALTAAEDGYLLLYPQVMFEGTRPPEHVYAIAEVVESPEDYFKSKNS